MGAAVCKVAAVGAIEDWVSRAPTATGLREGRRGQRFVWQRRSDKAALGRGVMGYPAGGGQWWG